MNERVLLVWRCDFVAVVCFFFSCVFQLKDEKKKKITTKGLEKRKKFH